MGGSVLLYFFWLQVSYMGFLTMPWLSNKYNRQHALQQELQISQHVNGMTQKALIMLAKECSMQRDDSG